MLEARACGKPVVASQVGGIAEAVINEELGLLVPPRNSKVLADALIAALGRKWDAKAIAEYGKKYSWDAAAEEYLRIYSNIVEKTSQ